MSELPTNPMADGRSKAGGSEPVAPQSRGSAEQPPQEAARGQAQGERARAEASGGREAASPKVFPPDSPVDVPNRPAPVTPPDPRDTPQGNLPPHDDRADSSWADNTDPAPHKTNVRSSIIP